MNHIYRSIWSEALATWIAVPENTQSKGKRSSVRNVVLATGLLFCSAASWALPTGEQVIAGQVAVSSPNAEQMQINQSSQQAIMQWQGFSIAPNEIVNIYQPNASATLLNRVIGQDASIIQGQLHANGQVFLMNANGVLFGKTAQVDVAGLVASTHAISNADFLNANYHFTQGDGFGNIDNQGFIRTSDGGVVALIGTQISNSGTIATPKGTTALAAGKTVDLDFKGDGLVEVKVSEAALNALVTHKGTIQADGGQVILTAKAAGQLVGKVLNSEGVVQARSLASRNGEIILDGGDNGVTQVIGTLDVSGNKAGETGGTIVVTGDKVLLENTAKLNATGTSGGGNILVGGGWQGINSSIHQATATLVKAGAVLDASALDKGNGGTVVAWSNVHDTNSVTRAYGTFLTAGGVNGGDGGRIETSGHWLDVNGIFVDTSAQHGHAGAWLLDPWNVSIFNNSSTDVNGSFSANLWTPSNTGSIINPATIEAALNAGTAVTIATSGTGSEAGNITVASSINKISGQDTSLQLQADNAIIFTENAQIKSTSGKLNVILNADADSSGAGNIQMYNGAAINSNGGNIILGGGVCNAVGCTDAAYGYGTGLGEKEGIYLFSNSNWTTQLNSLGGDISLSGRGLSGVSENYGVYTFWAQLDTGIGVGNININGIGGGTPINGSLVNSSIGVFIDASNLYTSDGNISLVGKGGRGAIVNDLMGTNNYGVGITGSGSIFTISGRGNIDIKGFGGTGTDSNHGIWESISHFTTSSGNISLTGNTSGLTSGTNNVGMLLEQGDFNTSGGGFIVNSNGTINALSTINVNGNFLLGSGVWNQISNALPTFFAKDFDISGGTFNRAMGGDGSSANPYQLADIYGLQGISNSAMLSKSYVLSNNIDATVTSSWHNGAGFVPIANNLTTSFLGSFDGANHTITGLNINLPSTDLVGLFGNIGNVGSVSDVGLLGGNVVGQKIVGALAGNNAGSISNTYATGSVSGVERVGGLVGQNDNTVTNAYATGNVTGVAGTLIAGSASVGGLVGFNNSGIISNAYATGNVSGDVQSGGLVGANFGIGSNINNAYATGDVSGLTNIGGLVGRNFLGRINNTYAIGKVSGISNLGGLIGLFQSGAVTQSFWDTDSSGQTSGIGSGSSLGVSPLTTAQMFSAASFTGFNFTTAGAEGNNWVIVDNDGSLNNAGNATGATRPMLASEYTTFISSSHQLQLMAMDLTADYSLINNLDLTSQFSAVNSLWTNEGFVPIGNSTTNFTGTFDGLNHTITGLNINRASTDNVGLFGLAGDNVEIKNIGLIGGAVSGQSQVGALLGASGWNTTIGNAYATGNVSGVNFVGGLVGISRNTLKNSYSTGSVTATGYYAGGLVGDNFGKIIDNSYATGNVTGAGFVGGLVGDNYYGATIESAYATGKVIGISSVGGLVGLNEGNVSQSYATGDVTGETNLGGLIGFNQSNVSNSHYDIDKVTINVVTNGVANPTQLITVGGIYDVQYQDWLNNNQTLNIADYASTLPLDNASGAYTISNLQGMKDLLGFADRADYKFKLVADINLINAAEFFIPYFAGEFEGENHTISNLTVNQSFNSNIGLFGQVLAESAISHLAVVNAKVTGKDYVGVLAGYNKGKIQTAHATGSVSGSSNVGGLVGKNEGGSIIDAYATSNVSGVYSMGGLLGYNSGSISNSYSTGTVSGATNVGGLIGDNAGGTINNSHYDINNVTITVTNATSPLITMGGLYTNQYKKWISNNKTLAIADYATTLKLDNASGAYVISNLQGIKDLLGFADGNLYKFRLGADIDLSSTAGFYIPYFAAEFDGANHTISNLVVNQAFNSSIGMFGQTHSDSSNNLYASIHDLNLTNVVVEGQDYVGGVVGNFGSWNNALNNVTVAGNVTGHQHVGGLVGYNGYTDIVTGNISNSSAAVTVSGVDTVGGLVGYNSGIIDNVHATGNVTATGSAVGGLIGRHDKGNLSNAYATGNVNGGDSVGGLVGSNYSTLNNTYSTGSVSGNGDVGGLVGTNSEGKINTSYSMSNVLKGYRVGGLVGFNTANSSINNAYAIGNVGGSTYKIGGLVGLNYGSIKNAYATGTVDGIGATHIGGLIGFNSGIVENTFWDTQTTLQTNADGTNLNGVSNTPGATGKTTAELMSKTTYDNAGWDFANTWWMSDTNTRPFLQMEYSTQITNAHQLQMMAKDLSAHYTLANNLDLTAELAAINGIWSSKGFTPIGDNTVIDVSNNSLNTFNGSFDGLNHSITGLSIARPTSDFIGLIGSAGADVIIKNISLVGGNIVGQNKVGSLLGDSGWNTVISNAQAAVTVSGASFVGGLVGISRNSIENSYAIGNVSGSGSYVGGLVGDNYGSITNNSYAMGNVSGSSQVGGLAGDNYVGATISNAYATGNVSGSAMVGGLVGWNNNGSLSNTHATGNVTGNENIAGLVGVNDGNISASYQQGVVTGSKYVGTLVGSNSGTLDSSQGAGSVSGVVSAALALAKQPKASVSITAPLEYVGALVGFNSGTISNVSTTADVIGSAVVGGLVGENNGTILHAHATGNVIGTGSNGFVGGLVGINKGTIEDSDATGSVTGTNDVGGLVGLNRGIISRSYATGNVTGDTDVGGLIGFNIQTNLDNVYAIGNVSGTTFVGGLVGYNANATISNAYATGNVTGIGTASLDVAGLVGVNYKSTVNNTYATGRVTGVTSSGGLVGFNYQSVINNSFWDTEKTLQPNAIGFGNATTAIGQISDAMRQLATFTGWSISATGGDGSVWRIYEGHTTPLLRSFLTPLTITADNISKTYNATGANEQLKNPIYIPSNTNGHLFNLATPYKGAINANTYLPIGLYSDQQGYDISFVNSVLTINPAPMTATLGVINKVYDGTDVATLTAANYQLSGFLGSDGALISKTLGHYNSKNVLDANSVFVTLAASDFALNATTLLSNYQLPISVTGVGHITPANLNITANTINKTYGQTLVFNGSEFTANGLQNGETVTVDMASLGAAATAHVIDSPYETTISNATGSNFFASNYQINYTKGIVTVTPATLDIIANSVDKNFGDVIVFKGTEFTANGLQNGETIEKVDLDSLGTKGTAPVIDSPYIITVANATGGTFNSSDYKMVYHAGTLTVNDTAILKTINDNVTGLVTNLLATNNTPKTQSVPDMNPNSTPENSSQIESTNTIADENGNSGSGFADNAKEEEKASLHLGAGQNENKKLVLPTLTVKNSAGQVKSLQMSANKQYLSLLLEDGSVRIWDLLRGVQRQILASDPTQSSIDITAVDDEGELLSIASKAKVGVYDVISATVDTTVKEANIKCFVSSNDGRLLLMSSTADKLFLWDREQNDKLWKTTYQRGKVMSLALTNDKRYGAVLSNQQGSYLLPANLRLKPVTDAIDIIDLENGKVLKSLPNIGEQVVSMQFKNNDTLQIALENGEVLNWSVQNGTQKIVAAFAEQVTAVDAIGDRYSYVLKDGTVRVGDGQGHVQLSIKNKDNPLKNAKLIDEGKKLLTVMASGDLALWDVGTGKKMLRLFSLQQGWTVMDAFGRFDGSEEALGNFSWLANEEDIPLDSFSENYYEPGLLASVLQNQDHLNNNSAVKNGITLPPKVELQLAEQQTGDDVSLQMDIYNRGGGIDKIKIYHNGRLLSDGSMTEIQASSEQKETEHRIFTLKVTPSAGKNTLKVIASNTMGIENSSSELSFDGKTKAYDSYLRVLTVGIDRYSDPQLNLDYSVADASLIGDAIKNNAKVSVSKSLYNENATKPKILAELKELSQGAQQDVLVIYFAGHGLAVGKEWYFLPYETKMQSTMEKIAQTGITATELGDIFKNSKIQHILLMVDSCYSGAGMDVFSKLENGQRYFTRQLSRSLGITVLTATAKDQEAAELKSLGHGLFTYLMGQQLQQTDSGSPVTAHGIAKSIVKALPIFSKRILGFSQEPVAYTHGSDFILSDELKSTIKNGTLKNTLPINRTKKESDQ